MSIAMTIYYYNARSNCTNKSEHENSNGISSPRKFPGGRADAISRSGFTENAFERQPLESETPCANRFPEQAFYAGPARSQLFVLFSFSRKSFAFDFVAPKGPGATVVLREQNYVCGSAKVTKTDPVVGRDFRRREPIPVRGVIKGGGWQKYIPPRAFFY